MIRSVSRNLSFRRPLQRRERDTLLWQGYRRGMSALLAYIDAWVANDPERIAACVTHDAVVTESHGPEYRGRDAIAAWAHGWTVTGHLVAGDREAAQWTFECTFAGHRTVFEGATIARVRGGLVADLREYAATDSLRTVEPG